MGQVAPIEIIFFDQANLPIAVPILQLFLACDGFLRRCERLDVDQAMHTVFLDEFRTTTPLPMLLKPCSQVIGDTDVERSVAAACENVDVICAYSAHGRARPC